MLCAINFSKCTFARNFHGSHRPQRLTKCQVSYPLTVQVENTTRLRFERHIGMLSSCEFERCIAVLSSSSAIVILWVRWEHGPGTTPFHTARCGYRTSTNRSESVEMCAASCAMTFCSPQWPKGMKTLKSASKKTHRALCRRSKLFAWEQSNSVVSIVANKKVALSALGWKEYEKRR